MMALRRASLPLRNRVFSIRASAVSFSDSELPNFDKSGYFNSPPPNVFMASRGLSSQAESFQWNPESVPLTESERKIKEAEAEAEKLHSTRSMITKFVNFRMRGGKRTKVRSMLYKTFHRVAQSERDVIKLIDEAVENVKPVCKVEKVGIAGAIYDVPGLVSKHRQESLAIRWILEAASKRRVSNKVTLEKCLYSELMDAYRKRGVARKKRENVHKLASDNRSFAHFRWW